MYGGSRVCHLSLRPVARRAIAAYPPAMDEQPLTAGIFGLATRRMCGDAGHPASRWALTPPFHPYRGRCRSRRLFSVTLSPTSLPAFR